MRRAALTLLLACEPAPAPHAGPDARAVPADSPATAPDPILAPVPPDTSPPTSSPSAILAPVSPDIPPAPPPGFVDLRLTLPGACFAPGYAAADNFTGAALPGYASAGAWLLAEPAAALARLHAELARDGLTLLIFDAYRPARASAAMVEWAERSGQARLVRDGYIASRSGHNHGHTIDLGLARLPGCEPLDMGTPWDTLDARSHTQNATGPALANRLRLRAGMRSIGFHDYSKEWWHFGFPLADTRPRDVPYGPHEPPERE